MIYTHFPLLLSAGPRQKMPTPHWGGGIADQPTDQPTRETWHKACYASRMHAKEPGCPLGRSPQAAAMPAP